MNSDEPSSINESNDKSVMSRKIILEEEKEELTINKATLN